MSVQWHATGTGQRAATPSADPVAAERVVLGDGDDVAGSLRCLVYYVLLPALFTLALLVAITILLTVPLWRS